MTLVIKAETPESQLTVTCRLLETVLHSDQTRLHQGESQGKMKRRVGYGYQ